MSSIRRISLAFKALRELGPRQVGLFALYQTQLHSGYLYQQTRDERRFTALPEDAFRTSALLDLPERGELRALLGESGVRVLLAEADEIAGGRVRLFGGEPVPLDFGLGVTQPHWTELEKREPTGQPTDIKWTWEAGRFGWVFNLGRAYVLSGDEQYPGVFWDYLDQFLASNPPYRGAQWVSAQEAALRLVALSFAGQVFSGSSYSSKGRMSALARALAAHAGRIQTGTAYARAQNNNHLLSEAAGLFTAGLALPDHPQAGRWREAGWRWFVDGLESQIAGDGSYVQNSTNYHRLMLQLALWVGALARRNGLSLPERTISRLGLATRWLLALMDAESGRVPNLGPNDGAYILPLTSCPFSDYRPVLQAASQAFLGEAALPEGIWDEMGWWLGEKKNGDQRENEIPDAVAIDAVASGVHEGGSPAVLHMGDAWAYLRAQRFTCRPGHADQLHVDLWWRGLNLAVDAGSYLYNAPPPWDNSLARSQVHNTVTVNGLDQMTRAGRFLWLEWAQARLVSRESSPDGALVRLVAEHDGYRRLGVLHRRSLTCHPNGLWVVEDSLSSTASNSAITQSKYAIRLHWLLPYWPWKLEAGGGDVRLVVYSPFGAVTLTVRQSSPPQDILSPTLVRAGECLSGSGLVEPFHGWAAQSYGYKSPALSFAVQADSPLPLSVISEWQLPETGG